MEYGVRSHDVYTVTESSKAPDTYNYDKDVLKGSRIVVALVQLTDVDPDGDATNGTLRVMVQESGDGSTYTTIPEMDTGTLSAAGDKMLIGIKDRGKSYLRVVAVVGTDVVDFKFQVVVLG